MERSLPKSTLTQHFRILREAGLIRGEREGDELQSKTKCHDLCDPFGMMIDATLQAYQVQHKCRKRRGLRH